MNTVSLVIILALLLLVALIALVILWIFIVLLLTRVPYVKTPKKNIEILLKAVYFKKRDVVFDLGCGDADVLIAIEQATGARTVGYEISPFAYIRARWAVKRAQAHTELHFQKFQHADVTQATHIFLFLIVGVMKETETWLQKHAVPGTKIVCYGFALPTLKPQQVIETIPGDKKASKFYVYML